ncbi:uncharacterized protein LOC123721308 [Papilio machaon]|uniref:uncharacterized protein LOC123721308 n=1 Tax=Papilio machaon TaxID=76193 RepID=UPI001E663299|nr:uncharacterized protein LOC123721308 [Papilio machaon]
MHIFCDASLKAYAAVVYWRFIRTDGKVFICFVTSKSRVSPLRPVSVPRLELQAALLAARLASTVRTEHTDITPTRRYFWTDSKTVLQWIRSDPRTFKPYVAHRLGEIDELTRVMEWRYVPTGLNVADVATREDAPEILYSDNGTNFRGADAELKRSLQELNFERLQDDALVRGIEWRFIPPGAPEMGGAWERLVRSVKTALKVVLKERAPHFDTLSTLMCEVEALINSRPITHVSTDPNYPEALTPNHFLIGTSSSGTPYGKYDNGDLCNLGKRWRVAQRLTDLFWSRWLKEYLPTLLPRQKWNDEAKALSVGDYVLIVDPQLERGSWKHGVVSAAHAGEDGRVRCVDVQTRTGVLKRPVTRVALLEV